MQTSFLYQSCDPVAYYNISGTLEDIAAAQGRVTELYLPQLASVVSGEPAAYMNEASPEEKDWQELFYGKNYAKPAEIKKRWDPEDLFYEFKSVGSDAWEVDDDGRLCQHLS